jgi:hypothetical protein
MRKSRLAAIGLALLLGGGCSSYYKVTDPTTGRVYYTEELQRKNSGAATLRDARTGSTVNLQNSEIEPITKEQYETGRHTAPPAEPARADANPFK